MRLFIEELKKLLRLTRRDPKSLAAGIIAPTVVLLVFALTFGNFAAFAIGIVNHDAGPEGEALAEAVLAQTSPLSDQPYFTLAETDAHRAATLYHDGALSAVLTIPPDFSDRLAAGDPATVDYALNNYNSDLAKNLRLYLDEGILAFYEQRMPGMDLEITRDIAVSAQLDWFSIIAVGVFLLAFLMGAMFNFLYLFNKERDYATLSEYRLASASLLPSFGARITVALFAGSLAAVVNALLTWALTSVNILRHSLEIAGPLLVTALAFVSFAALVSLLVPKFSGAAMLSMVATVVIWFLSGATTSVKYAAGELQAVSLALPSSYALSQIRSIVFDVDHSAGGLLGTHRGWLVMGLYAVVLTAAAYGQYHRSLGAAR
ncbi:ABC transporter permease [Corynebacterium uterequi]|uniref:ABC-2 family transporter protein n=1 Tax=Corynebacterium uterequi TaxID=1072256 RepID=A0A0G3HEI7_9CORY|nr:ABC transporter permease [Corynebacterium uterequi]AKK11115.1 ABC-2 family transporter protein [Corynebacterium uterequi]